MNETLVKPVHSPLVKRSLAVMAALWVSLVLALVVDIGSSEQQAWAFSLPSDDSVSTTEVPADAVAVSGVAYYPTGQQLIDDMKLSPSEYPEGTPDGKDYFYVESINPRPANVTYCFLLLTDTGTFFIAPNDDETTEGAIGEILDFHLQYSTMYYCPTTLTEYADAENMEDVFEGWQRVTEENIDSIPIPDFSAASPEHPVNLVLDLLAYDGAFYPADTNPGDIEEGLYIANMDAPFSLTSPSDVVSQRIVYGSFAGDDLFACGDVVMWLSVPGNNWLEVGGLYQQDGSTVGRDTWGIPVGAPLSFACYNDYDQKVALEASVETDGGVSVPTGADYSKVATFFNFRAPDDDFYVSLTKTAPYPGDDGFVDVAEGSWYYNDVRDAAKLGYIHGYNGLFFGPNDPVTRAQSATVLFNMADQGTSYEGTCTFSDVAKDAWYYKPVSWAETNGIIEGYGISQGSAFGPNDVTTREQLMAMLCSYAKLSKLGSFKALSDEEVTQALAKFPDADQVSSWARNCVAWCVANGVVDGISSADGTVFLAPQSTITRAQVAAMAVRLQPQALETPLGK